MTKNEINQILSDYIRHNLSPRKPERERISKEYERISNFLGKERTFQNGSYARFTSTTPVNDLDVIYELPEQTYKSFLEKRITVSELDINNILESLALQLKKEYQNEATIKIQPHSVGIFFGNKDDFSIDVVPAIPTDDGKYLVPESFHLSINKRRTLYESLEPGSKINWIKSDPKGYIKQASDVDKKSSGNFRKSVKFAKKWKHGCKDLNEAFPLKSFHLELIITRDFKTKPSLSCLDAIEKFFNEIDKNIVKPQFPDLADPDRYVDAYINELTDQQKALVIEMQEKAKKTFAEILQAEREAEVFKLIEELLLIIKATPRIVAAPAISTTTKPYSRPYCNTNGNN